MPTGSVSRLLLDGFSIVLIDLLLAGDNALVIAMAVRALPQSQRRLATTCGAAAAVILRIALTILAARLLGMELLKMLGGALIVWIAVKVLADSESQHQPVPARSRLLQAIWMIVFADITMSIDNVLAVAGAARGNAALIVFGLALSIPFVVFASNLTAALMDRFPVIVYLGSAILGKVGVELFLGDPFITRTLHPSQSLIWTAEAFTIAVIVMAGRLIAARRPARD